MLENEISTPEVETLPAEVAPASFDLATIGRQIEAILMVVDEPVTEITLASVLQVPVDQIVAALEALVPTAVAVIDDEVATRTRAALDIETQAALAADLATAETASGRTTQSATSPATS